MGKNKNKGGLVYSTNSSMDLNSDYEQEETLAPSEQMLRVMLDRKNRGGKTVTIIAGFIGTEDDLQALGKKLKAACGVGGSIKDGEIIIQGEKRDFIMPLLEKWGFKTKRVGG